MSLTEESTDMPQPLVVAITGASGVIYGVRILDHLADMKIPAHLVVSKAGERTLKDELDMSLADVRARAERVYPVRDIGAAIASGSFLTRGMVVAPCSIKTMSEIATGVTSNLVSRAADVILKERRRLVLMVRETPLHGGHIETMGRVSRMGAIVAPPVPAFYARPDSLDTMIDHTVGRVLDLFDLKSDRVKRWQGSS